jgi:hypothetical protein
MPLGTVTLIIWLVCRAGDRGAPNSNGGITMPHEIKVGDVYIDKAGRQVRIVCTDRKGHPYTVVGLLDVGNKEMIVLYTEHGEFMKASNSYDLILHAGPYDDWQIDDKIWVWDDHTVSALPRHFAGLDEDGRVLAWQCGATSHTTEGFKPTSWQYASKTKP